MQPPKNWPSSFLYIPRAFAVDFHTVLLETFVGTGYEADKDVIVPILDTKKVYNALEILIIDTLFCENRGIHHPLVGSMELAGHEARGVFAKEDIEAGTVLGEYGGVFKLELSKYPQLQNARQNPYLWQIQLAERKLYIDGFLATNELGFVNEYSGIAEAPNTVMKPLIHRGRLHFCYVTERHIPQGEEILTKYNN